MFDLGGGGAERVLVNLVNNLDPEKYDIHVRTIFGDGVNAKLLNNNIKFTSFFKRRPFGGFVRFLKLFSPKLLHKIFIIGNYDIEIAFMHHSPTRIISGAPEWVKKFAWIHGSNISTSIYRNYREFQKCYKSFDKIAFVAKTAQDSFLKKHPFLKNSEVVYNLIDEQRILSLKDEPVQMLSISNSEVVNRTSEEINRNFAKKNEKLISLCSIGRLSGEKGYDRLIKVLGRLKDEGIFNWHLYLLGEGAGKQSLINQSNILNLSSQISFLGYRSNPYKYLSKMDLFICSSYTEAFSTAVSEAVILGIPFLTSDVSGMAEIKGETNAGIIVPNSEEGLYGGLKELLTSPEKIEEMKKEAASRASFFSTENAIKAFEHFIFS